MFLSFKHTVSALVYSLINERCHEDSKQDVFTHNQVVNFVLEQHGRSPDFLRTPIKIITLVFDAWPVLTLRAPFHRQPHAQRWCQVQNWRGSRLGLCRNFIRFYENLVIYCWYAIGYERVQEQ
jgi:hypothetical protein